MTSTAWAMVSAVVGVLAVIDHEALVAFADQRQHLGAQLVVCEGAPHDVMVV